MGHSENRHDVVFFCWGWSDLDKILQTGAEWHVNWSKSKPDVEFQYGGHLGELHGMSSQNHLPHCRVLPTGEFNVMIPQLRVTLRGAATGRIQRHVIPEPHITLQGAATWWIHCGDSRATCRIAGCSHLAKSMSWSCHIAGCKNSIRHIDNRFSAKFYFFLFFYAVWALMSGNTLIIIIMTNLHLACSLRWHDLLWFPRG